MHFAAGEVFRGLPHKQRSAWCHFYRYMHIPLLWTDECIFWAEFLDCIVDRDVALRRARM